MTICTALRHTNKVRDTGVGKARYIFASTRSETNAVFVRMLTKRGY